MHIHSAIPFLESTIQIRLQKNKDVHCNIAFNSKKKGGNKSKSSSKGTDELYSESKC